MGTSKVKFPPIHKVLGKSDMVVLTDYIYVKNYHAVVLNPHFALMVDLKTKFEGQSDENAEPDYNYETALDVLEFLDDKLVSGTYWEELVNAQAMVVEEDYIHITSRGSSKELHHIPPKEVEGDSIKDYCKKVFEDVMKYNNMEKFAQPVVNFPLKVLTQIASAAGKPDNVIIESMGPGRMNRFTFESQRYIFGVLTEKKELNEEMFLNHYFEQFQASFSDDDVFGRIDWSINEPELDQETKDDLFSLQQKEKETPMEVVDLTERVKSMPVEAEEVKPEVNLEDTLL